MTPRKPQETQKNLGSDMSISALVQPHSPNRLSASDRHYIKGLNVETIGRVFLPPLPWLATPEYSSLCSTDGDSGTHSHPDPTCLFFSLNIAIYGHQVVPAEWANEWFWIQGRVHPYALTWEVDAGEGATDLMEYTIPIIMIRDQGYQPIAPRTLGTTSEFPTCPPSVSFTGPVAGSGDNLLVKDSLPTFDDRQLRCCGFVQLSTYVAPGKPDQTPFKGFHGFLVFVIFPINANPWTLLCKKMTERADSQFTPGTTFTCTGKVAGLLRHGLMAQPPDLEQDYVFIVVPDTWTFGPRPSGAAATVPKTPTKAKALSEITTPASMAYIDAKALFLTPPKARAKGKQPAEPQQPAKTKPADPKQLQTPISVKKAVLTAVEAPEASTSVKRALAADGPETPSKKPRPQPPRKPTSPSPSFTSNTSDDEPQIVKMVGDNDPNEPSTSSHTTTATASSRAGSSSDMTNRNLRNRYPTR
ncbi:hypothetical protein G7Z17_g13343 [Cylindrodendrum hubeiense]|uniref:Uncharacterized protein n=1 Tax=Cylindrodendrum hubeiense TaxID=595255 RepID=A0A9P5L8C1_9HYPO|nr:hypothetical protein G7Z17_g13343 [Cylindrodendrum hubeiense]